MLALSPGNHKNVTLSEFQKTTGGNHMRKLLPCLSSILLAVLPFFAEVASASDQTKDDDRLRNCGTVLKEILDVPDDISQDLLDKADCVVVFPSVLKAAFIVGGSYGRGAMSCRKGENFKGPWGAPTMMALEGGSFGFQIGGQATDFVLLVMNESGASGILISKVKLGADASVTAGPVGRDASADTDATLRSEILSYSTARGLFAGISLEGSTLRPDNGDNRRVYGRKIPARSIVLSGAVAVPPAAEQLISTLDAKTRSTGHRVDLVEGVRLHRTEAPLPSEPQHGTPLPSNECWTEHTK